MIELDDAAASEPASSKNEEISTRIAASKDLGWINEWYESIQFKPSEPSDTIVVGEFSGRGGIGRLVPLSNNDWELGGIFVHPNFRGKGLARAIVKKLVDLSPEKENINRLWCIPFSHLVPFYSSFGFVEVTDRTDLPCAIKKKMGLCGTTFPDKPVSLLCIDFGSSSC